MYLNESVSLKEIIHAYAAGLFDGEGCINVSSSGLLNVEIQMTSKDVLDACKKFFGGNICESSLTDYEKDRGHKNRWIWYTNSDEALVFLKLIQQYSIVKKEQIDLGIKFQEEKIGVSGRKLSKSERDKRVNISYIMKCLKKQNISDEDKVNIKEMHDTNFNNDIINGRQGTIDSFDDEFGNNIINVQNIQKINDEYINNVSDSLNIGYFARFFDAEGYVGIGRTKRSYGTYTYKLDLLISNTNYPVLLTFKNLFGGNIRDTNEKRSNRRQCWQWQIYSNKSLPFLEMIYMYTIEKKEQIEKAVEFQKWKNKNVIRGVKMSGNIIELCEWYCSKLKYLKKECNEELKCDTYCNVINARDENQSELMF